MKILPSVEKWKGYKQKHKQRNGTEDPMSWQKPGKDKGIRSKYIFTILKLIFIRI